MCGIYLTSLLLSEKEIHSKLDRIKYRGPDNLGFHKIGNISLGHLRLSIIDIDARSNQPYKFNDLVIVYNGEIYNFQEIREDLIRLGYTFDTTSDTEVLIKGYDAWGESLLGSLNGMFAFAIYDSKKQEVFCARDRLGVKPFYYYYKDGNFEICSQIQPLINSKSEISNEAIEIYLSCGYIPSPYSILKDVFKLQPGHILKIDLASGNRTIKKYWDLEKVEILDISYEEAKEKLEMLLFDAVKIRLRSDVPLGTFLSGGIDSALITAIASRISDQRIKTFTIGFKDPSYDESKIAENFSSIFGTDHTTTICEIEDVLELIPKLIQVYDEPFADSSALPSLLLNKVTKEYVTVALSGDGGDESFIGYNHFNTIDKFNKVKSIPFGIRKMLSFPFSDKNKIKHILLCENDTDFIKRIFLSDQKISVNKNSSFIDNYFNGFKKHSTNSIQKAADLNIKLWLENDSNVKVDRASMAYSVEVRSPFLDYRIIEFARKLPMHYKFNNGDTKIILKDILSKYIPREVYSLPKSGFSIPIELWLKTKLKDDFLRNVNEDLLESVPGLDISRAKDTINDFFKSANDQNNNTVYIWRLYILNKWLRNFHDIKK